MDVLASEIWVAVLMGLYEVAGKLIYRGANVNEPRTTDLDPMTTLIHYTAARGDLERMIVVINLGANVNVRDSKHLTPLHLAVTIHDCPDVIEVLVNAGAVVDSRDQHGMTPLHIAVQQNFNESARKLIARGACVDAIDIRGRSVLHQAVFYQNLFMVKVLIGSGVNMNAQDLAGRTPLRVAFELEMFNINIVRVLLENGADVNKACTSDIVPLHCAVSRRLLDSLHLLLKFDARVNERTNTGDTALHVACLNKYTEGASLLLKFGADMNVPNDEGTTPFELLPANNPYNEPSAKILIREAVRRETLGHPVYERYRRMVQSSQKYEKFDQECREEFERMRNKKIDGEHSVTFFDLLSMQEEKLATLVRNKKIAKAFKKSDYRVFFSIYAGELATKFEVAQKRAKFLRRVEGYLLHALPAPIVRNIAAYIKPSDIR